MGQQQKVTGSEGSQRPMTPMRRLLIGSETSQRQQQEVIGSEGSQRPMTPIQRLLIGSEGSQLSQWHQFSVRCRRKLVCDWCRMRKLCLEISHSLTKKRSCWMCLLETLVTVK